MRTVQRRAQQRGSAALIVVALLCLAALLALGTVAATSSTQQRTARLAERSAVAFHAAEAGLDWALAQLDDPRAMGEDCAHFALGGAGSGSGDVGSGGGAAFAPRLLAIDVRTGAITPVLQAAADGTRVPVQPACSRAAVDWLCVCPGATPLPLPMAVDASPRASFRVHLEAASAPRTVQVVADGCSQAAGDCAAANGAADAVAHVRAVVGLLPALVSAPSAALTVAGAASSAAALGVHNADASSGGVAVQAGRSIDFGHARLTGAAGAASGSERLQGDAALAALDFEHMARRLTGLDTARWRQPAAVQTVVCQGDCSGALRDAAAAVRGPAQLWVDGDVALAGPIALGTSERPVLLLAAGHIALTGGVQFVGVLLGGSVTWNAAADGAPGSLRGAALSATDYGGDGTPDVSYDRAVLQRLRTVGRYARVAGSWKDF